MSGSYPHHISRPLVIFNLFTTFYYYFLQVCDYWRKSGDLVCQDCSRSLNKNWKRGQTKKKKKKRELELKYFEPRIQTQTHRHSVVFAFLPPDFIGSLFFVSFLSGPRSKSSAPVSGKSNQLSAQTKPSATSERTKSIFCQRYNSLLRSFV